MVREPSYCHHKGKNLAYVRLNGRMFYLGTYNSPESKVAYARLKAEWLSNQHHPKFSSGSKDGLPNTMARLATAYLAFAKDYYKESTELENLRRALLPIAELYAQTPSDQFGPLEFKACRCVAPLKVGRTAAPESKPVLPVSDAIVDATIKNCTRVVADMIEFQRICGCRPGELIQITPSMVDRSGEVWRIEFSQHKNAHRGQSRCIFVGPRGQKILK